MILAKIVGNAISTCSHPSLKGNALFICQPIDENGADLGDPVVAISPFGGGLGCKVLISADGKAAQGYVKDNRSPLKHVAVCVIDQ